MAVFWGLFFADRAMCGCVFDAVWQLGLRPAGPRARRAGGRFRFALRAGRVAGPFPLFRPDRIRRWRLAHVDPHPVAARPANAPRDPALRPQPGRFRFAFGRRQAGGAGSSRSRSSATARRSRPPAWRPSGSNRGRPKGYSYRHYRSKWFTLDSTADEQNTRRVIVRAEQIFAAYRQIVPPRERACPAAAAGRAGVDGPVPGRCWPSSG